jgi:two-component system sensor histidine kinase TctE
VFERFYRIPGSRGEGCGLGLAIVKEIADRHGAQITVNGARQYDRGTRIEIVFVCQVQ